MGGPTATFATASPLLGWENATIFRAKRGQEEKNLVAGVGARGLLAGLVGNVGASHTWVPSLTPCDPRLNAP